jgi:hypothetical protein
VTPTEHTASPASTSKTCLFATLRGLLHIKGSGAGGRALDSTPGKQPRSSASTRTIPLKVLFIPMTTASVSLKVSLKVLLVPVTTGPVPLKALCTPMSTGPAPLTVVFGSITTNTVLLITALFVCIGIFFMLSSANAEAATVHQYEPALSKTLSEGVPVGCGESLTEPPCISGPEHPSYGDVSVSGGRLWLSDSVAGHSRVDAFNPQTGALVPPQLDEAPGVGGFGVVGVAEAFGSYPQLAYVQASGGVAVFEVSTGTLLGKWTGAHTANDELSPVSQGVAVDGRVLGNASGDVYVATRGNVVDVFSPKEAELEGKKAGEEPAKAVAEIRGTCEAPGEALPCTEAGGTFLPFTNLGEVAVSPKNGDVVVVDNGVLDVFEPGVMGSYTFVRRITEAEPGTPLSGRPRGLAIDGNGDIYLTELTVQFSSEHESVAVVYQFSEMGALEYRFTGTPAGAFSELGGVGVDPVHHDVFIANLGGSPSVVVYGPSTVVPDVTTAPATELHATHVQLNGTVKLDGAADAACVFEYGTTTGYGSEVPCVPPTVTEVEEAEHSGEPIPVKATITELSPDTTYFYRVSATNSSGIPSREGPEDKGEVTTAGPGLHGEFASEVAATAASLGATINPNGLPTSYYFQYTTSAAGTGECEPTGSARCTTIPATPEALGSVPGDQNVSQPLQGLEPGKTYHYRVVVVSEPKLGEIEDFAESDATFTTQPPASGFALPDGRQWELVTPPDKHGATPRRRSNGVTQASVSGGEISYLTTKPTEEGAPGFGYIFEQVLSTRGKGGWESQDLSEPHAEPAQASAGNGEEYRIFSEDLSSALVEPIGEFTSLKPDVFPPDTESTPYIRHDLTCASTPSTCYEPLLTAAPGYADVPPGTHFGATVGLPTGWSVMATTPDLTHVILGEFGVGSNSKQPLKQGAPSQALYEWSANAPFGESQLQLVSVLPDGTPTVGTIGAPGAHLGLGGNSARAVSHDGARVVWTGPGGVGLYLTDTALPETAANRSVRLDVPKAGCKECGAGAAILQTMDNEGSRVIFSDSGQLLPGVGAGDLYECAIVIEAGAPQCKSHPVAPGAGLLGETIVGASEDGSYIYFVSNARVAHGAVNGNCTENSGDEEKEWERATPVTACNLYMVHYDSAAGWEPPVLVGVLSGDDQPAWRWKPDQRAARVSPDGRWLAFMSSRSLTGYDNRDAHSGRPDEEVFLYHAGSGSQPPRLVCASCDPTGARPTGFEVGPIDRLRLATNEEWPEDAWLAGTIPSWTGYTLFTALYQSRYLFDSGRLFFNSSDALVPQDINNQVDVYEFEPAGIGSCTAASSTYSSATGGCVSLISSGTSHQESGFYDASASGDDVFFMTAESLVAQDPGGSLSVYDAHVCGAEGVPCTSVPVSPPKCTTADACWPSSPPQPEVFGAPAGATFSGPGNLTPAAGGSGKPKTAEQIRIEKLNKALNSCHKDRSKKKRTKCEAAAKKKYGPTKKSKKAKKANYGKGSK